MPRKEMPSFGPKEFRMLEIPQPGIGGLNLKDLEFEQDVNQSPWMLNMMYRNGAFSKRYGQGGYASYEDEIYAAEVYRGDVYVHAGTKIYNGITVVASGLPERKGLFVLYNQNLYYFCDRIYSYDGTTWGEIEPYVPIVVINRTPDATSGDTMEPYNMVGTGFQNIFHGDGTSTVYQLTDTELDEITPKVLVDNEEWTYDEELSGNKTFKVDYATGQVTMNPAPLTGTNNVEITAYKHDDEWNDYHDQILASKYYSCFGGNNNSRLFLAGGGKSTYYYSEVYDASYFPYINYARVGNSADDITGFGQQYNVLLIFKPTEIFSLSYYQQSSSTTTDESQYGLGAFASQMVNARMGCDCPHSIQLINNQLTWFSSKVGVCTLLSTNIQDERNVRVISRNIERSNGFGIIGILDMNEDPEKIQSVDFDSKYFLCFPSDGYCFVWDYAISPYFASKDPKNLTWFLFDHFYVKQFVNTGKELLYISSYINGAYHTYKNIFSMGGWETRGYATAGVVDGVCHCIFAGEGQSYAGVLKTFSATQGHRYYISYKISNMNVGDLTVNGKSVPPTDGFVQKTSLANAGTTNTFELMARQSGQCEIKEIMFIDMTAVYGSDIPALEKLDEIYGSAYHAYNVSNTIFNGVDKIGRAHV